MAFFRCFSPTSAVSASVRSTANSLLQDAIQHAMELDTAIESDARARSVPYVGDPHFDVIQHVLNCTASLRADPISLLTELADLAGLDPERVKQWLFARCVEESLRETTAFPDLSDVLRVLGRS